MCQTHETKCQCRFLNLTRLHLRTKVINNDTERVTTNRPPQKKLLLRNRKNDTRRKIWDARRSIFLPHWTLLCLSSSFYTHQNSRYGRKVNLPIEKRGHSSTTECTRVRQGLSLTTLKLRLLWQTLGKTLSIEKSRRCQDRDREGKNRQDRRIRQQPWGRIKTKVWQSKAVNPSPLVDEILLVRNRLYFKISLWKLRAILSFIYFVLKSN